MEKQLYFSANPRLFGMQYIPQNPNGEGILIVHAFLEEKKSSQRHLVEIAQHLCKAGFTVLLFDLRGCGDDQHQLSEVLFTDWIKDIESAITFLLGHTISSRISIIGLRLGSYLCTHFTDKPEVTRIVLLAPVIDPIGYLRKTLRSKLMKELITGGHILSRRTDLLKNLEDNKTIDMEGHTLSGRFYNSLISFSNTYGIPDIDHYPDKVTIVEISHLVVQESKLRNIFPSLTIINIQMELFWLKTQHTDNRMLIKVVNKIFTNEH